MICSECDKRIAPEKQITIEGMEDICYDCYKLQKKTVCVDFDGVIAEYTGWRGPCHFGAPTLYVSDFLAELNKDYKVVIHTTRKPLDVYKWLSQYGLTGYVHEVTNKKVPAIAYIDDRALCFTGLFSDVLEKLKTFKPHWKG